MSDYPKISTEAEALIDAVLRGTDEEAAEAMYNLHHYIEALEKRRKPTNRAAAHREKE